VDAVAIARGSAAIIVGNLLIGWAAAAPEDELFVLVAEEPQLPLPESATVESIASGSASLPSRLWAQSVEVRRVSRRLGADALLGGVTASALLGAACPYGVVLYDLRHELRPGQFPASRRLARRLLYGWSFLRADALICISERTRRDLLASRPQLSAKAHVALLGADHAVSWRASNDADRPYMLAFGHFPNKNVDGVLRAWRLYEGGLQLRICGLGREARASAERLVSELGLSERVHLLPWLSDEEFEGAFAGASGVLFPSDFEGFGLPAIEALRLGIPLVISPDPALLEVTGRHAIVASDDNPETLAAAIERALRLTPEQLEAGTAHARSFTWERMARQVRAALAQPQMPVSSR
jgi:glycosyltransferase involved in cell wall biosynthesis